MIKNLIKSIHLGRRYKTLINYLCAYHGKFQYELSDLGPLVIYEGRRLLGFSNSSNDEHIYEHIKKYLPSDMQPAYYRTARDVLTRYIFPHMIPQLKPFTNGHKSMNGFHGQHKDSLQDIDDLYLREKLMERFAFRHNDIVMNCGAYIGFGDIRVSSLIPNGRIISIEAKKECFDILSQNMTANRIPNVTPCHKAVWNRNGQMDLNTGELQSNSLVFNASHFGSDPKADRSEPVETTTIDSLAGAMNLPKVDFISLTLNGAEIEAIEGAKEVLSRFSPRIRLAGWYKRNGIPIWKHCSKKLKSFGYQIVIGRHGSLYAFK